MRAQGSTGDQDLSIIDRCEYFRDNLLVGQIAVRGKKVDVEPESAGICHSDKYMKESSMKTDYHLAVLK